MLHSTTVGAVALFASLSALGCGPPPPPSAQELLKDRAPAIPVQAAAHLKAGAEATIGSTTVLVESVESIDSPRDITKSATMDSLALVVAVSSDVEAAASEIGAAAEAVKAGVKFSARLGNARASAHIESPVREQAAAVRKGASDIQKVASAVAGAASLALALGQILGKSDETIFARLAASTGGTPHRATCSFKDERRYPRPSVSCAITRADGPPTVVWHLDVTTQPLEAGIGRIIPASRGWLRAEPQRSGSAPIWISRPDESVPFSRRGYGDVASFALQQEATAVARMRIADATGPSTVWLSERAVDDATLQASTVALAIMSLVHWPPVEDRK